MKTEDKELKDLERLGALLDGESSDPEGDRSWVASDPGRALRYRQYQRLRALTMLLEDPAPEPEFTGRVLARVSAPGRPVAWRYAYALAAGLLVMIGGFGAYLTYPYSSMEAPPATVALEDDVFLPAGEAPLDPEILLYGAAEVEGLGMTEPLASLEVLTEEELLCALAALAEAEEVGSRSGDTEALSTLEQEPGENAGDATSFVELLDFVDTLDAVEADVLNQALRAALEEA